MIVVVSGLPRSGTSVMMQMLAAGGLPILTDGVRTADEDNLRGYFEWEPAKRLPQEPGLIREAEGKAVKIISSLLLSLPDSLEFRIIFMRRPLAEVVASQAAMIQRRATTGAALGPKAMMAALENHLKQVDAWLETQPNIEVRRVEYHSLIEDPHGESDALNSFLGMSLDAAIMAQQVDPSLRRQRGG